MRLASDAGTLANAVPEASVRPAPISMTAGLLQACLLCGGMAVALLAMPAPASAQTVHTGSDTNGSDPNDSDVPHFTSSRCGLATPYNVLVDSGGLWLYRAEGTPREIRIRSGELSVDGKVQPTSEADLARLREIELGAQRVMPQVTGIANESVDIAFDALAGVVEVMTGSRRRGRDIERMRSEALQHVASTLGTGRWDQDVFGDGFEERVEAAAERMSNSLGRSMMWQMLTGGAGRMERRAEKMETEFDARMEARSTALERQAQALCDEVENLQALQDALEFRWQGLPLRMIEPREDAPSPREQGNLVDVSAQAH